MSPKKGNEGNAGICIHEPYANTAENPVVFTTSFGFLVLGRPTESTGSTAINKSTTLGSFYHLPPYLKLYDVLKATHTNFKVLISPFSPAFSVSQSTSGRMVVLRVIGKDCGSSLGDAGPAW